MVRAITTSAAVVSTTTFVVSQMRSNPAQADSKAPLTPPLTTPPVFLISDMGLVAFKMSKIAAALAFAELGGAAEGVGTRAVKSKATQAPRVVHEFYHLVTQSPAQYLDMVKKGSQYRVMVRFAGVGVVADLSKRFDLTPLESFAASVGVNCLVLGVLGGTILDMRRTMTQAGLEAPSLRFIGTQFLNSPTAAYARYARPTLELSVARNGVMHGVVTAAMGVNRVYIIPHLPDSIKPHQDVIEVAIMYPFGYIAGVGSAPFQTARTLALLDVFEGRSCPGMVEALVRVYHHPTSLKVTANARGIGCGLSSMMFVGGLKLLDHCFSSSSQA